MTNTTSDNTLLDGQAAARYLGVSLKTIRRWAQSGKLKGKKIGSRGDWRFSTEQLDRMVRDKEDAYGTIKRFLTTHADEIEKSAVEKYLAYLGGDEAARMRHQKNRRHYLSLIKTVAKYLDNVSAGQKVITHMSSILAESAIKGGFTLEEMIDALRFLRQALWKAIEKPKLLQQLTTMEVHALNRAVVTYSDILYAKITLAYQQYYLPNHQAIKERELRYRTLFASMSDGFCIIELLYDEQGNAYDYRFLEINAVFEDITKMKDPVGKTVRQLVPTMPQHWIDTYAKVARTGKANRSIDYSRSRDRWYEVYATRVGGKGSHIVALLGGDVTERRQMEQERAAAKQLSMEYDELVKIGEAKDEFIGIASHQLRTPATAVKQYIGLLLAGMGGELTDAQQKYLETAYASNERQLRLINDLLKTAQLDTTSYTLNQSFRDVTSLLLGTVTALQPLFDQRNQTVEVRGTDAEAMAHVDPVEMDLVFSNLLENASKYSHDGSTITVALQQDERAVEISFTDQGVGISADDQDKIFEKFTRISNELSGTITGTGLGLYWVRHIVQMHGGTVTVASEPGHGSTFTVTILR